MVQRDSLITLGHMTTLAAIANSKTQLPGRPYAFPQVKGDDGYWQDGGWTAELARLRKSAWNALHQVKRNETVYSGPWPVKASNSLDHEAFGTSSSMGAELQAGPKEFTYSNLVYYRDPVLYSYNATGIKSVASAVGGGRETQEQLDAHSSTVTSNKLTVKYRLVGGPGRFEGAARLFASGLDANDLELTGADKASGRVVGGYEVQWDKADADGVFEIGFRLKSGGTLNAGFRILRGTFTVTTTNYTEVPGIHKSLPVKRFTPPSDFGVYLTDPDAYIINQNGFRFNYRGTVGDVVHYTPDVNTGGIWFAKSPPVHAVSFHQRYSSDAPPTLEPDSEFTRLGPPTEFQIPIYPFRRNTDPDFFITGSKRFTANASVIRRIAVMRGPEEGRSGQYVQPRNQPTLQFQIGIMRNGQFVELVAGAIPADTLSTVLYPTIPVFSNDIPLVYIADSPIYIAAEAVATISQDFTPIGLNGGIEYPLLADHYNDTMRILEQLD